MYKYRATVARIIDGDTVRFTVDCGFHLTFTDNFRLAGINAPELYDSGGHESKAYIDSLIPPGTEVTIHTTKGDKYGRWLCSIYLDDGRNVNQLMLDSGMATPYV